MSGKITIPKKTEENKILGENNADNNFSTSLVNANSTGTVIERIASIQTAIGSAASQLKVSKSISSSVEEGGILQFSVSFIDIDSGVISSDNIDITSITQELAKSTGGGAFSTAGITQPVFIKSNGIVSCSYHFLEDEWYNGDMYRMTISGITVSIGGSTAYIEIQQWSGEVTDDLDILSILDTIENKVDTIDTVVDNVYIDTQAISTVVSAIQSTDLPAVASAVTEIQVDLGNPSIRTNLQTIEAMLGNPDEAGATLYAALTTGVGQPQVFTKAITSAANAGDVTIATVTTQPVLIKSLTVHSDGATTADLTSIAISGGAGKVIEFITSTEGVKANIDAQDKQVSWPDLGSGGIYLPTGSTIIATLAGTGATAVDLNVVIEYVSTVNGGYLA